MLLAIGLSALLWTVSARPSPVSPAGVVAMSAAAAGEVAGDSDGPADSDRQWRAQHDAIAPVTESAWKSAPVHAALAATQSPRLFETALAVSSPDSPASPAPAYLRHTPLLI